MLPANGKELPEQFKIVEQPSKTYQVDKENKRIIGRVDGLEAVKQTIYHVLNTERYDNLIFSWNYGVELKTLYGRPHLYVQSELKRRIKEALIQDDRIKSVDGFIFARVGTKLSATFTVHTTKGDIRTGTEVEVNV